MYIPSNVNTNCGIYRIKNMRNGKCYIGSSSKLNRRKNSHFSLLKKGKHHNKPLQKDWDKENNKDVFQFQIFIYCSQDKLKKIEQGCLDNMNPEYNRSSSSDCTRLIGSQHPLFGKTGKEHPAYGHKHTEKAKTSMSKNRSGQKNWAYGKKGKELSWFGGGHVSAIKIIETSTRKIFDSINDAARYYNLEATNIVKVCKGKRHHTGGYHFEYLKEGEQDVG